MTGKKGFYLFILAAGIFMMLAPAFGQSQTLNAVKGSSEIRYLLIHPLHEVNGVCKDFICSIEYDDATHTVKGTAFSADVTSFDSGNSNRDSHAMEVLDALNYPTVSFKSREVKATGQDLQVSGDLTFHGVTKPVILSAMAVPDGGKLKVKGKANVSLTAFNIERPSLLFLSVQDTLRISFDVEFSLAK